MDILDEISAQLAEEEQAEKLTLNRIGFEARPLLWHTIKQYANGAEWDELKHLFGGSLIDRNDDLSADVHSAVDLLVRAQIDNNNRQTKIQRTKSDAKSQPLPPRNKFPPPQTAAAGTSAGVAITEIDRLKADISQLLQSLTPQPQARSATAPTASASASATAATTLSTSSQPDVKSLAAATTTTTSTGTAPLSTDESGTIFDATRPGSAPALEPAIVSAIAAAAPATDDRRQRVLLEYAVTRDVASLTRPSLSSLRPASARPLSSAGSRSSRSSHSPASTNRTNAANETESSSPNSSRPASASASALASAGGATVHSHAISQSGAVSAVTPASASGSAPNQSDGDLLSSPLASALSLTDFLQPYISRLNVNDLPSIRDDLIRAFRDEQRLLLADIAHVTRLLDAEWLISGRLALADDLTLHPPTVTELQALKQTLISLVARHNAHASAAAISQSTQPAPAAIEPAAASNSAPPPRRDPIIKDRTGSAGRLLDRTAVAVAVASAGATSGGKRVSSPLSPTAAAFVPTTPAATTKAAAAKPAAAPLPPTTATTAATTAIAAVAIATPALVPSNHRFRSPAASAAAVAAAAGQPPKSGAVTATAVAAVASATPPVKRSSVESVLQLAKNADPPIASAGAAGSAATPTTAAGAASAAAGRRPPSSGGRVRNRLAEARQLASSIDFKS